MSETDQCARCGGDCPMTRCLGCGGCENTGPGGTFRECPACRPMAGDTDWAACSDPPEESCSDAGCPVHGGDQCPDCGRGDCTGEDCYWPDEAALR